MGLFIKKDVWDDDKPPMTDGTRAWLLAACVAVAVSLTVIFIRISGERDKEAIDNFSYPGIEIPLYGTAGDD